MHIRILTISALAATTLASAQQPLQPTKAEPLQVPAMPTAPKPPRAPFFVWVHAPALKIGDAAPKLNSARWVKGQPILRLGDGRVHVIGFWSTWSDSCRQALPFMSELARKYRNKVDFAAIAVREKSTDVRSGSYVTNVARYARAMGSDMDFTVAADDPNGTLSKTWLDASGQVEVPVAFVVDGSGRIAWAGHPMSDLEDVLDNISKGKFSTDRAVSKEQIRLMVQGTLSEVVVPIQVAIRAGQPAETVAAIDKALAVNPGLEAGLGAMKFQNLLRFDEKRAYTYAQRLADSVAKDNPAMLNMIAWTIVDDKTGLKKPDLTIAVKIAQRAAELTAQQDPYILDTLAYSLYRSGKKNEALVLQAKAVSLAEQEKSVPPTILKDLKTRLALFRTR